MRLSDRMIFGDSPEQGIVRNHTFYHAPLGFTLPFPAGWKVRNSPASVTATAPDNTALMDLRGAGSPQATPAATLRRFLKLGAGSETTPITISGLPAATIDLNLSGKPTRVAAIHLGKAAYVIGLQGNDRNGFNKQLPLMMQSLRGFHAITESERALARPLRVRVITAGADDTFRKLASRSPLGQFAEGHLRLLNGRYPAGEPVAGEALKIVE
jgi:predicted Zn-dependent protease